jgi:probable F420-dependent oxidoreductase
MGAYIQNANLRPISYRELQDYADILRRLWAGETIDYDGPIGRMSALHMADRYEGPAPQIYSVMLGGPKACRVAASPLFDGVYLQPFMTVEAVHQSVVWLREEAERIGRDPDTIHVVAPIISAPEMSEERERAYMHARMVTYISQPGMLDCYRRINGWDPSLADPVRYHEMFQADPDRVDHNFHREQLMEVAKLVPDDWTYGTSLTGSLEQCVATMQRYRDAGADEICFYGSTPTENATLIAAWREHVGAAHRPRVGV